MIPQTLTAGRGDPLPHPTPGARRKRPGVGTQTLVPLNFLAVVAPLSDPRPEALPLPSYLSWARTPMVPIVHTSKSFPRHWPYPRSRKLAFRFQGHLLPSTRCLFNPQPLPPFLVHHNTHSSSPYSPSKGAELEPRGDGNFSTLRDMCFSLQLSEKRSSDED